jgi:hypothetical protein
MRERNTVLLKSLSLFLFILFFAPVHDATSQSAQRDQVVELSATTREINGTETEVQVCWRRALPAATSQTAIGKPLGQQFWSFGISLAAGDSCFLDTIPTGDVYEYAVLKDTSVLGLSTYGYIAVGSQVEPEFFRGKVLIVLDTTYKTDLQADIDTLERDLIGDGWQVEFIEVSPSTTVATVKLEIVSQYSSEPSKVNSVLILGDVAVPYSGGFSNVHPFPPDGHTPQHNGAWAADAYYADIHSSFWTDASVNITNATRAENDNVPADGKFDQSTIPTFLELMVGRVDLSDLPAFASGEKDLLQQYLRRDHDYRHGNFTARNRALLDENFGLLAGEAFGGTMGYRNISPLFGDSVINANYLTTLDTESYKWAFAFGAGNYNSLTGLGTTANLASSTQDVNSVFNVFMGSYFGDWDNSNNFLRAPLATTGTVLTNILGGRPNLFFHTMAMGQPIGYGVRQSINNYDIAFGTDLYSSTHYGSLFVHTALMGDPTLRLNVVQPITALAAAKDSCNADTIRLTWTASTEPLVTSYYILRAETMGDSFIVVGEVTGTSYNDTVSQVNQNYVYMVRAAMTDTTNSGNYVNLSQGVFSEVNYLTTWTNFADTSVCSNDTLVIGDSNNNANYISAWTPNTNILDSSVSPATVFPSANTSYVLQVTGPFGCSVYDTVAVTALTLPTDSIGSFSQTPTCGDSLTISSTNDNGNGFNYAWTFQDALVPSISGDSAVGPHLAVFFLTGNKEVTLDVTDTTTNCSNSDSESFTVTCATLPVELVEFTAEGNPKGIQLDWTTSSEFNNSHFDLEYSLDGLNFHKIVKIPSKSQFGYSNQLLNYDYLDENKYEGVSKVYYRLKQVDLNGDYTYYNALAVLLKTVNSIYPNPVKNDLTIGSLVPITSLELHDLQGRVIVGMDESEISGTIVKFDLKNVPPGNYILKVTSLRGVEFHKITKE